MSTSEVRDILFKRHGSLNATDWIDTDTPFYIANYVEKRIKVVREGKSRCYIIKFEGGGEIPDALKGLYTEPKMAIKDIREFKKTPYYRRITDAYKKKLKKELREEEKDGDTEG